MEEAYQPYRAAAGGGRGEIEEKKSRFLASVSPAVTQEEALAFIEAVKKQYWDARHHCYAYIIGRKGQTVRCSDDGEPAGTAGRPILDVLEGQELKNTVIVVTRYFGGTLLGTGGLARAYTRAAQAGLADSGIVRMRYGTLACLRTDYNSIGRILYLLGQRGLAPAGTDYGEQVCVKVVVPQEQKAELYQALTEAAGGRIGITEEGSDYFIDKARQV